MIDALSGARLRAASEFLAFVKNRGTDAATLELLTIPGFEKSFARGMRDMQGGPHEAMAQGASRCIIL